MSCLGVPQCTPLVLEEVCVIGLQGVIKMQEFKHSTSKTVQGFH